MAGDDDIIDEVAVRVSPDLSGFRRKLERELKTQIAGIDLDIPVKINDSKQREALNYVAGLRAKHIQEQLSRVRNGAEKVGRAEDQARQHELKQIRSFQESITRLHLQAQENELKRVRSTSEKVQQGRDQAFKEEADRELKRVRSLAEKVDQARQQARQSNDKFDTKKSVDQQRKDEAFLSFQEKINSELTRMAQDRANDEITIRHSTSDRVAQIEREASKLRIAVLAAEEKVERESLARTEKAEKASLASRKAGRKDLSKELFSGPQLIDYGGKGIKPMNALYGVVVAMSPALVAMGASALQASTSIAALGSAGIGAAAGLSGVAIAFQGIGDLLSLRKQVLAEGTTKAANAARSTLDLTAAKRNLADAQRGEAEAADDLHKARREAIRDLEDLKQAVIDLDNQYKSDTLSVAEAKERATSLDQNYFATALERARAHQDVSDAETKLKDTTLERKQKQEDLKKSLAGGIEKSDRVKQARERVRDARDRRLDAQAALSKQAGGAAGGIDKVSSAAAQLKQKIKELGPAAEDMFNWFVANEELFKRLRREINNAVLPGFTTFLKAISAAPKGGKSTLEIAAQYAGELGGIIGKYAGKFGEWTKSQLFRTSMAKIQTTNARAFEKLGEALFTLADPILRIVDAAAPGFESLSAVILDLSKRFADWIKQLDDSGALTAWFTDARIELSKWWDIVGNIAELFKNIFTAALPSGSSLVTSFRDFTQSLVDWSNSPNGQKDIKDFFQFFKDLPYAQIVDFFKNATTFFVAFRTFKMLSSLNPLMLAFGSFAAANPQAAADAFVKVGGALAKVLGFIASNPAAASTLLALFAAWKGGKALGIDLKLPVMDKLAAKFKVLDKFIGGGATAGTMNVQAAVVNIYGGAAPGTGAGTPVAGGTTKPGRFAVGTGSNLALSAGLGVGGAIVGMIDTEGSPFQKGVQDAVSGGLNGAALGTLVGGPIGTAIGAAIGTAVGLAVGKWQERAEKMATAQGREDVAFNVLKRTKLAQGASMVVNDPSVANLSVVKDYIKARKENVDLAVENERALHGEAAAERLRLAETQKSVAALSDQLQVYGWTKQKADAYSRAIYDLNGLLYQNQIQNQNTTAALLNTATEAEKATVKFKDLNTELLNLTGEKKIILTVDGKKTAITDLEDVAAYQQLIRQGKPPTEANLRREKNQYERTKNLADGGKVPGYSPHPKADNIPAMLTANEYVQPVAAVKHYGTDFMEAIRTRRLPRYAAGGQVDEWPFKVKMPDALKPIQAEITVGTGSDQEYKGRTPRGLGAVGGLGERMMAAVIATHARFPWASVNSGYRPGARTVSGNASYHGKRRATDWPASMELFNYFVSKYGNTAREIIYSPAGKRQIWNGRPHMYSGAVRATHFNHVHLALADGGLVPARKYDRGGLLPPGYSTVYNGTGKNEVVRTDKQERALTNAATRLDRRDLALLAQYMASATGNPAITMDGRRVAETTNRYAYLPAGV